MGTGATEEIGMTYEVSQEFKDFMIALKAWVDAGCPDPTQEELESGMGFRKRDSICFQIGRWTINDEVEAQVDDDLNYLFCEEFGQSTFPFNKIDPVDGDSEEYENEIDNESHYKNPARVKWINDTVASFGDKK